MTVIPWLFLLLLCLALTGCGGGDDAGQGEARTAEQEQPEVRDRCTVTVKAGESIQQAIAAAPSGAVICLEQGEWEENVTIRKDLVLQGKGAELSVIRGAVADRPVLTISALAAGSPITAQVQDLMITGGVAALDNGHGVLIEGPAEGTLKRCIVSANQGAGIIITGEAQARVHSCVISGHERVAGVLLADDAYAIISETTVTETRSALFAPGHGIWVDDKAMGVIAHSVIERNDGSGVRVNRNARALLAGNRINLNGEYGVSVFVHRRWDSLLRDHVEEYPYVEGASNLVAGQEDPAANRRGAFNVDDLESLSHHERWAELPCAEDTPQAIHVEPGQSIQEAIDRVACGGVVQLAEGEWEESLMIYKSVSTVYVKGCGYGSPPLGSSS